MPSIQRWIALGVAIALGSLAGCSSQESAAPANGLTKITVQLDWVAEPEHGGFYQAQAKSYFRDAGLDVTLIQGGPNAFATQKVATGQVQFAQADSTNTILAINEGLPITQVAAVFQQNPSVLMLHAENPITSFEELDGATIMARPEWAFLPYLENKYKIDFKLIPFNFSVANFIADRNFIQQGFYIAEPFFIEQGGGRKPKFLYAWDAGFDSYVVLVANSAWAAKNPEATKAFLAAYIRGWDEYLHEDPTAAHEIMKAENEKNTDDFLAYSRQMIIDENLVTGRGADGGRAKIGQIEAERFSTQIEQLEALDILKPAGKLTADQVMTREFLPAVN
ncbi:MAG: ABC transporter substrate-binding protein [Synoicihabitans sp.]